MATEMTSTTEIEASTQSRTSATQAQAPSAPTPSASNLAPDWVDALLFSLVPVGMVALGGFLDRLRMRQDTA